MVYVKQIPQPEQVNSTFPDEKRMGYLSASTSCFMATPQFTHSSLHCSKHQGHRTVSVFASKSGGFSLNPILKRCQTCGGKGAIECPGCKV
ncbi:hypothetical protein SLEP1_g43533 [Rubroshorea leprosula]|uniref:Uncharacterized protein n=1 Tax=Rubroshorea leprosula TaxID=152421 RepID=A0AAV5LEU9_9ROSI|nr:hypothetical protein SLEP1_g43533 [Rubroshorea leprosula]